MSEQSDQPETPKKPVRVAIIGHVGYSRGSILAAMGAALAAANVAVVDEESDVLVEGALGAGSDWPTLEAMVYEPVEPRCTRVPPNHGDRTYENPFSRRARRRR